MEKFYCNICNKEVNLKNGKCPDCGTDWYKIMEEPDTDGEPISFYDNKDENREDNKEYFSNNLKTEADDIKDTYSFYLKTASIGKYIILLFALVIAVFSLVLFESTDGYSLSMLFVTFALAGYAIIFEKILNGRLIF